MRWIATGRQLGQAVKNVGRLRQILAVLARNGFADVITRLKLGKFLPNRVTMYAQSLGGASIAERLKVTFEQLGPTFVKLGQLLSTRPDLIPEHFIDELKKLQDNVLAVPFEAIQQRIAEELEVPVESVFSYIDPTPLASASIAQVHAARLRTGDEVVIKVQRPGIDKIIETDLSLLAFLAKAMERYIPESRIFSPTIIVEEFFNTLVYELDFHVEANNMKKMADNLASFESVVIPTVYKEFSTSRILTLQKLVGIAANNIPALDAAGVDRKEVVRTGARVFFKSLMVDGLFHGDLHGGNVFILPGNKLGIIDFGIVGRLSVKSRDQFAAIIMAMLTEDYENMCYQFAEIAAPDASIDLEAYQRDVRNTLSPYMGLDISEIDSGKILVECTKIAATHNIRVPGEWMVVFKGVLTLEGMGRTLDPEFNFLGIGQELLKDLVKSRFSVGRVSKDLGWMLRDVTSLMQTLPRQIRWMFRKFSRDNFAFELKIPQLDKIQSQMETNGKRTSLSMVVAGLFIASSIALQYTADPTLFGLPLFALLFFTVGALILIRLLFY